MSLLFGIFVYINNVYEPLFFFFFCNMSIKV
jgi:hypothetical protein